MSAVRLTGIPCGIVCLLSLVLPVFQPLAARALLITPGMHHLRSGPDREWADFPATAADRELVVGFEAVRNAGEQTLRVRHRDLKQPWVVLLNGSEVARLPFDESDMITYWVVPAGGLRDGGNELRVRCTGPASDDVLVGEIALLDRPRAQVLSEATLDVAVYEEPGHRPTPARITIVDEQGTLIPPGNVSGPSVAVRPGVVYSRAGPVRLVLPAGRYVVHAGRGFEYSVASTVVDLPRGGTAARQLTIRREVDTAGWAAMDTHVHTGEFARHGDAALAERMLTIAAEGIELPVSTEHNLRVDFEARARSADLREYFTPVLGSEVTTPSLGHFNVFPLPPEGPAIDHRSAGWTPLRESIGAAAAEPVVVLNHAEDVHGGFRPFGRARHVGIAGEDLDGWTLPANAMEVVNSGAVMTDALALPRQWMGMLNRGSILTPVGSSDSHDVSRYIVGQGRTYVRTDDRDPARIDVARAMDSVKRGRVLVSYGLLAEIELDGRGPGELATPKGPLAVRIRVKGPAWTRADRVALYMNGERVREEPVEARAGSGVKWEGTWRVPGPAHDVHLVAIATGPGVNAPYWPTAKPYQPTSIVFTPYVLAVSGAVFVDGDANGRFDSAFDYARREVSAVRDVRALPARLGPYDTAVAVQAASLLRARDPAGFARTVESLIERAPPHVARGLAAYLQASRTGPI